MIPSFVDFPSSSEEDNKSRMKEFGLTYPICEFFSPHFRYIWSPPKFFAVFVAILQSNKLHNPKVCASSSWRTTRERTHKEVLCVPNGKLHPNKFWVSL